MAVVVLHHMCHFLNCRFENYDNEEEFLSSAQRSAICWHLLENVKYGEAEDEIGISHLCSNNTFGDCFPLHDVSAFPTQGFFEAMFVIY